MAARFCSRADGEERFGKGGAWIMALVCARAVSCCAQSIVTGVVVNTLLAWITKGLG
jgi:hypothetical protein